MQKLAKPGGRTHPFTKLIAVLAIAVLGLAINAALDGQSPKPGQTVEKNGAG